MNKARNEFGDNCFKRITRCIYKWIWCYLVHRKHRCWPRYPNVWHCMKCHKCGEGFEFICDGKKKKWF